MSESNSSQQLTRLIAQLIDLAGSDNILLDEDQRILYSMDIWARGETAAAVVRPANTQQLSHIVKLITDAGYPVVSRGGGMSYTRGYVPMQPHSFMIDYSRMNSIIEINAEDMYVTVEAGCSWKKLYEALSAKGLRTPYWGPLSGSKATVGGSISQNSIFWGGGNGSAVDSVVSMEVVVADGSVVVTGSAAQRQARPFFRHFGPDLTGLFSCDCGALGLKATITLQLKPAATARGYIAYNFRNSKDLVATMNEVSRLSLASECFGFDPTLTRMRAKRDSLLSDVRSLAGVMNNSNNIFGSILHTMKIAFYGRRHLKQLMWPMYVIVEERNRQAVKAVQKQVVKIANRNSGVRTEDSIPRLLRANPFGPVNNIMGPGGERWVPVHGLVPLSQAIGITEQIQQLFDRNRQDIDRYKIQTGFLYNNISSNCMAIEPLFFWPDAVDELHKVSVDKDFYQRVNKFPPDPEAYACVATLRQQIIDLLSDSGASHLQIGRTYRYSTDIKQETLKLISSIKNSLDPDGLINPGVLGL